MTQIGQEQKLEFAFRPVVDSPQNPIFSAERWASNRKIKGRRMLKKLLLAVILATPFGSFAKELYRPPTSGDSGTYYVLKSVKLGSDQFKVLTSRIGKGSAYTDFTELKVNCETRQYFVLAGGEEDGAKETPTETLNDWSSRSKWSSLVPGSSKSDLVNYVCSKQK